MHGYKFKKLLGIFTDDWKMGFLKKIICTKYFESQRDNFPMFFKWLNGFSKYI